MTLKELMAADALPGGVFLPLDDDDLPSDFNELVWFYPEWSEGNKVQINAVVVYDHLEGTREVHGDGVVFERSDDRSLRESIIIECQSSVAVRTEQTKDNPDGFRVGEVMYVAKRILGKDADMQSVLCIRGQGQDVRTKRKLG